MADIDKTWSPGPGCCRPGHERGKLQLSRGSPAKSKTLIPVFVLCRYPAVDIGSDTVVSVSISRRR